MIYHWCPEKDWTSAGESYSAASLAEEGFIHFSYRDQVEKTATEINAGQSGLVLMCVDDTELPAVDEDSYGIGEEFPHVYAPIPRASVVAVVPFPCEPDGSFCFPKNAPAPS